MDVDERVRRRIALARVFTPAAPVDEKDLFAGRIDQVNKLIDAIGQRGQHAIIYGERGVGKTSLANVLQQFLTAAGQNVIALRFNADDTATFTSVWHGILAEATRPVSKKRAGLGATPSIEQTPIPLPEKMSPDDVRRALLTFDPRSLPILIIDEFDKMPGDEVRSAFANTIKNLSDHSVNATVVIVGVGNTVDELLKEHQSIDRALVQIAMPRMTDDELRQIIDKGLKRVSMTIDSDAADHITALSQGLPYYTHLLTLHAGQQAVERDSSEILMSDVESAIKLGIEGASQSIRSDYEKATQSPQTGNLYRQVLLACALAKRTEMGFFPAANVREPLRVITRNAHIDIPNYAQHLHSFSTPERGAVLEKSGQKHRFVFRFRNPLMQPFVTMRGYAEGMIDSEMLRRSGRPAA